MTDPGTYPRWWDQATELDNQAAHYRRQADREQAARGPGYYPNLLRTMAYAQARKATAIRRTHTGETT